MIKYANLLLYADDFKSYVKINSPLDCWKLKKDLCAIEEWVSLNGLVLYITKTEAMSIYKTRSHLNYQYNLSNSSIDKVTSMFYLGVTIYEDLSFDHYNDQTIAKTYNSLGFIKRFTRNFTSCETLFNFYKTLVRFIL